MVAIVKFKLAAAQGNVLAQLKIGFMYYTGEGVEQDYIEAFKWSKLAADQNNAEGQFWIGFMFRDGQGVAQDYAEALKWLNLAAAQDLLAAPSNQTLADMVIHEMRVMGQGG